MSSNASVSASMGEPLLRRDKDTATETPPSASTIGSSSMEATPQLQRSSPHGETQRGTKDTEATEKSPLNSTLEDTVSIGMEKAVPMKMFLLGMGGVFLSHALQGLSAAGVQILNGAIPTFELNLWRVAPVAVFLLPFLVWRGMNLLIPRSKIPILMLLIAAYNTQNITYYYAARTVALGTLTAMQVSIAIFFSTCLAICIIEGRSLSLCIGAVVSVVGLIFMAQPTFLGFHHTAQENATLKWTSPCHAYNDSSSTAPQLPTAPAQGVISAMSAVLIVVSAAAIVCQANTYKILVSEGIPFLVLSWWIALGSTLLSLILMFVFETPVILKSPFCSLLVALHCIGVEQSLIIVPWSVNYVLPAIVTMSYAAPLIVQIICQHTFLKHIQPGYDNWQESLGAVLCLLGIVLGPLGHMIALEIRRRRDDKARAYRN
jgi:drug/metabolite transporter (DMT)-like permease